MRFLALLILICSVGFAEDLTMNVVLPPDAKQAIASYDAAVAKAKADVIAKLQKAQETATKRGDLDGAMAIKARLAGLGKGETVDLTKYKAQDCLRYKTVVFVTATYGKDDRSIDCMPLLRRIAAGEALVIDNNSLGHDPAPNQEKSAHLEWISSDGSLHKTDIPEGKPFTLDALIK